MWLRRAMPVRRKLRPIVAGLTAMLLLASLSGAGCRSSGPDGPPEARYGHRYEATAPDGRAVMSPDPIADTSSVFVNPVYVDSLRVRISEEGDDAHRIDVVIDGTLADACTELHDVRQRRHGHIIEVALLARRPKGAMCAQMIQPFRTYFDLDGTFAPGAYTLKVNDAAQPFEVE